MFVFFKQKTAYDMRISDWSSDVCSSDRSFGAPACGCGPNSRRIRTGGGRSWTMVGRDRMRIYRTPDERFAGLPDWPYAPNYRDTADGLRVHSDRTSVVSGKNVSVRLDLGGPRILEKQHMTNIHHL